MRYILDFDRTLLDTDKLKLAQLQQFGVDKIGTLESLKNINIADFLFPDSIDFLKTHEKKDISIVSSCLGITKMWDVNYQKEKVKLSGVANYVNIVHVVADAKNSIVQSIYDGSPTVFVDDMSLHLLNAKEVLPELRIVQIARVGALRATHKEKNVEKITTIENLNELDAIIEKT